MARPNYQVLIDWNGDNDFVDANEDVTSDVVLINLDRLRDPITGYMSGAILDLQLKNSDHKYSPPKGTITGLQPGRKVWVRMWYPFDDFDGVANTNLESHSPALDDEWFWDNKGSNLFELDGSGGARVDSSDVVQIATMDFSNSDVTVFARIKRATTADNFGLTLRFADSSNYVTVQANGTTLALWKTIGGSASSVISTSFTWADNATKDMWVQIHNNQYRVYIDDVLLLDTELDESAINSATQHGLYAANGSTNLTIWDNFGGFRSLFFGKIDAIRPRPKQGSQYCYIHAVDDFELARSTTLFMASDAAYPQSTSDILNDVLDYMGITAGARILDDGVFLIPDDGEGFSGPAWGVPALQAIQNLQDEEDGFIYIDGLGFWRFEDKAHRFSQIHIEAKSTIKETDDGSNAYFNDLSWSDGRAFVENIIDMQILPGTDAGVSTVWSLKEKVPFIANESREFLAEVQDFDAIDQRIIPVENTDYEANTESDDSGTDLSSGLTVTIEQSTKYNGRGALIKVIFGATAGYLTKLDMRATVAVNFADPVHVLVEDTTSQAAYGERVRQLNARYLREFNLAEQQANTRLTRRKDPRTRLTVRMNGGSKATMSDMIQRSISDAVSIDYSDMGISEDFFIDSESWRITEGGKVFTKEIGLSAFGDGPFHTGWKSPSTMANFSISGDAAWSNVNNAKASDDSRADVNLPVINDFSDYLLATNFGFSLPTGATPLGVEVRVELFGVANAGINALQLFKAGAGYSFTKFWANEGGRSLPLSSDGFREWGAQDDLWGASLSKAEAEGSTFGVGLSVRASGGAPGDSDVDHMQIRIWYTTS